MKKKHKEDRNAKKEKKDKKSKENEYSKDDLCLIESGEVHSASKPNIKTERSKNLDELREEAQEITEIMMDNVIKIRDREGKLDDLLEKAENLHATTEMFQKTSVLIRRKQWLRNNKWAIVFTVVCCLIIVLAVVLAILLIP